MACSEFLCDLVFVSENKILGLVCMHFLYADNRSVSLIVILNFYEWFHDCKSEYMYFYVRVRLIANYLVSKEAQVVENCHNSFSLKNSSFC